MFGHMYRTRVSLREIQGYENVTSLINFPQLALLHVLVQRLQTAPPRMGMMDDVMFVNSLHGTHCMVQYKILEQLNSVY